MSAICTYTEEQGYCVIEGCEASHPDVCDICDGIQLVTDPNVHYLSRGHLRSAYEKGLATPTSCPVCSVSIPATSHAFVTHYASDEHVTRAANTLASAFPVLHGTALRRCHPCNRLIQGYSWNSHRGGSSHRAKLAMRPTNTSADSRPITETDFGVVAPGSIAVKDIIIFTHDGVHSDLVSGSRITMMGSVSSSSQAPFEVSSLTKSQHAVLGISLRSVPTATSGLSGRVRARLEVLFSPEAGPVRPLYHYLSVTIGNQDILAAMAPTAPFVRPARKKRASKRKRRGSAQQQDLHGERLPFISDIIFTVPLPPYDVPSNLREALESKNRDEQEDAIANALPEEVSGDTHGQFWGTLLHSEEVQVEQDLHQFDMDNRRLTKEGGSYSLEVPGLAERRPSVLRGDKIKLFPVGMEGQCYVGYVHGVRERRVVLRLHTSFNPSLLYNVEFCVSRSPFRRMHQAVHLEHQLGHVLFPEDSPRLSRHAPVEHAMITPLDPCIIDNVPQRLAVTSILRLPTGCPPYIIFGPPGTGKTLTAVEAIRQVLALPNTRILACAPSNFAADVIAERLVSFGIDTDTMFRLNALSRMPSGLPESLKPYSLVEDGGFKVPLISKLLTYRIIVSTCISSSFVFATGGQRGHFTHIFVDECGHALEPEALVPILTMASTDTKVILSGDPKQLGPITHSLSASSFNFGKSLLERYMEDPLYAVTDAFNPLITKLVQNYRSHPAILGFPNQRFYDGELTAHVDPQIAGRFLAWPKLNGTGFPVIFHAIHGEDMREERSPSYFNPHELSLVDGYLHELLEDTSLNISPQDIGVISPYNAHNKKLRTLPIVQQHAEDLKTGSVEAFQAQERPVIIISTVRSSPGKVMFDIRHALGFVANPKRLNVAITRARSLLIIIGDPAVLSLDQIWNELLHYIRMGGGWRGVEYDLPPLDDDGEDGDAGEDGHGGHDGDTGMGGLAKRLGNILRMSGGPVHDPELPIREDE